MPLCQPCGATRLRAGWCCRPRGSLRSSPAGTVLSWCPASAAGVRMSHCSCRKAPQDLSALAGLALVVFCWSWCVFFHLFVFVFCTRSKYSCRRGKTCCVPWGVLAPLASCSVCFSTSCSSRAKPGIVNLVVEHPAGRCCSSQGPVNNQLLQRRESGKVDELSFLVLLLCLSCTKFQLGLCQPNL